MSDTALYLVDLRAQEHAVTYETHPEGGYRVKGLPVLKPGTYHGIAFDEQHLTEIATNFRTAKNELGYQPPLRPFHAKPGERVDVRRDLLGVLEDCYLDGQVLKTDARVFDDSTVEAMQAGRFPYLSGEFRINPTQHDGRTALRGLAFVDAPECKGLPWKLVMNAEEFPEDLRSAPVGEEDIVDLLLTETSTGAPMKQSLLPPQCFLIVGDLDNPDTWHLPYRDADVSSKTTDRWGRIPRYTKAGPISCRRIRSIASVLKGGMGSKIKPSDLPEDAVRKLKAAAKACGVVGEVITALSEGGGEVMSIAERIKALFGQREQVTEADVLAALEESADPPELRALRERAEKAEQDLKVAEAERLALQERQEAEQYANQAQSSVEALLAEKHILPAQQDACLTLLTSLAGQEVVLELAEGGEEHKSLAEMLVAMLREGPVLAERYFTQMSAGGPPEFDAKTMVERMAASQGIKPK